MSLRVTPKDVHAVWLLLRAFVSTTEEEVWLQTRKALSLEHDEEVDRLLFIAASLRLIESGPSYISLTVHGESLASAAHWKLWTVPVVLRSVFETLGIQTLFLGPESWEGRMAVVDLFAGAGGFSLAFESAGYAVSAAIDNDTYACEAFKQNFPNAKVINRDIQAIVNDSSDRMRSTFGIREGEMFGVIGSPPCQGFSNIGERMWNDPRNELVDTFFDVVLKTEPLFFVFENVPALRSFGARTVFDAFLLRENKITGRAASGIIDGLPTPSGAKARRVLQAKRGLISRAVEEASSTTCALLTANSEVGLCETASVVAQGITKGIITGLPAMYEGEALSTAKATVSAQEANLAVMAISLSCQILLEQRKMVRKDCASYVERIAVCSKQHRVLTAAAERIVRQYESLPEVTEHRGVSIGPVLERLITQASKRYDVNRPIVLDAADYGAPQRRRRLFLVGIREEVGARVHGGFWEKWAEQLNGHLASARTANEAIGDLPDVGICEKLSDSDLLDALQLTDPPSELAASLRLMDADCDDMSLPRSNWNPYWLDGCKRTVHHESVIKRLELIGEGQQDKVSRRNRLHRDRPSHTLRAGTLQERGSHTAVRPIHFQHNRVITVREGARLMGYPDWMTFHGSNWHGSRLVGNGVPVRLGYAIAASLRDCLAHV